MSWGKYKRPECVVTYRTRRWLRHRYVTVHARDVVVDHGKIVLVLWDGTQYGVDNIATLEWT